MGYFGKSITASDTYADYTADLLYYLGWRDDESDDYKPDEERVGKEGFEGRVEEICQWMIANENTIEHGLFLAYHLLLRGVDVSDERLDKFIEFCNEDAWGGEDIERRIYMQLAVEAIEKYKTDKTPIDIDFYYDFEKYYIEKRWENEGRNLLPVEDIVQFFEKYADIKIINSLRSMFELYFVISHADYNKIKGQSIMGIKFITAINE